MIDIDEVNLLAADMTCAVIDFYGAEKNINNEAAFVAMIGMVCFSMVERFEDDAEIIRRINLMLPIALKQQRDFAKSLPPDKPIFKIHDGGKLN